MERFPKQWNEIKWAEIEQKIYNWQRSIFDNTKANNMKEVWTIQRKMVKSPEAKLLAVRRITQDNRGKATAGVDGIKNIKQSDRINLSKSLILDGSAHEIKRVWIPKANGKLRPIGIPTIKDRCKQMLILLAFEPQWEARFENNVYGFRPGYSAADAKKCITRQIQGATKYFLDADIKGCFDNINHEALLNKLNTLPMFEKQIESWLKAGVLDQMHPTLSTQHNAQGTPQGGVISPLLCNIALHGMENMIIRKFSRDGVKVIRYADDFVIMGKKLEDVLRAKEIAAEFLATIGLELSSEKTRIGHTLNTIEYENKVIKPGLDFLGFHFKNIATSKHRGVKSTKGKMNNFIQISKPSLESVRNHKKALKYILRTHKSAPRVAILTKLSLRIQGWTNYFSITKCSRPFSSIDGWFWKTLWKWAMKRYKTVKLARKACFSVRGWQFGFRINNKLYILKRHDQTKTKNYIKIKAGASIYSGDILYFCNRMNQHNDRIKRLRSLMVKQNWKCEVCKLYFMPWDVVELHHILNNGVRSDKLQFLHGHCHDKVHSSNN